MTVNLDTLDITGPTFVPVFTIGYRLDEDGKAEVLCDYHEPPPEDVDQEVLARISKMVAFTFVPEWIRSDKLSVQQAGHELLDELLAEIGYCYE